MRKIISISIVFLLLLSITACSGNKEDGGSGTSGTIGGGTGGSGGNVSEIVPEHARDAGYYVIDSITQDGETFDADDLKEFGINYYIALHENGTMEINTDSVIEGTWEPDTQGRGGVLRYREHGEDVISEYSLSGDLLTLEIGGGEVTLVFKKSSGPPDTSGNQGASGLSAELAWWDGDWYGYWTIVSGDGRYESMKGGRWDCYAIINTYADNTATVFWYDDDMFLGEVEIEFEFHEGYGTVATSIGGTLFDDPVRDDAWYLNTANFEHENMIEIDEWHEDLQGVEFRYKVYLRPWGMLWDDVPAGERPPDYDWYLGVRNAPMDDAFGSGVSSGTGTSSGASGNTGGGTNGGSLSGKYYNSATHYFEFFEDGTCALCTDLGSFVSELEGTYTVDGNTIIFKSTQFDDSYNAVIDGDTITWMYGDEYVRAD